MTLQEFAAHRPKDYKSFSEFLADHWDDPGTDAAEWELDFDIQPSYWTDILFVAKAPGLAKLVLLKDGRVWAWDRDL